MNEALRKSSQTTCEDTGNVTSSPESAVGRVRSVSPAGLQMPLFGAGAALVNRFRAPGSNEGTKTPDTSGRSGSALSRSADLQLSLENRLRARMDVNGSAEYELTWSQWGMRLGLPICALRASGRRTSGSGCSGWQTPGTDSFRTRGGDRKDELGLSRQAQMAGWRTPCDQESGITVNRIVNKEGKSWSPGQRAYDKETGRLAQVGLTQEVQMAGWATPQCQSPNALRGKGQDPNRRKSGGHCINLQDQTYGLTPSSSPAATEKQGAYRLNPYFSAWLQGYPKEWTKCGQRTASRLQRKKSKDVLDCLEVTETQSCRK